MSLPRSETQSRESDSDPDAIVAYLADPRHIPLWAPAFADTVMPEGPTRWLLSKDGADFSLRVAVSPESRTVDYLRQVAPGREGGAYIRVMPRLAGGSVIVMTLPLPPSADQAAVAATLDRELTALVGQVAAGSAGSA